MRKNIMDICIHLNKTVIVILYNINEINCEMLNTRMLIKRSITNNPIDNK